MFIDARTLEPNTLLDADVCIVGAGPAGITLAREFADRRFEVILLESGGLHLDKDAQALGLADRIDDVRPLALRRQFGGSANLWGVRSDRDASGVRLTRLSEIDFERRDWMAHSGWPIGLGDLAAHYERAQRVFQLEPGAYDAEDWEDPDAGRLSIPGGDVETGVFQFGSGRVFKNLYRRKLENARNVRVYHHATAVEVETDAATQQATGVRAASQPGREFRVRARCVVLSGGGMACAQLLLLSDRQQPEGLGNRHGLVGRYYMDHPLLDGGDFIPHSKQLVEAMTLYDLRMVRGVPVMGHLQIADAGLRREALLQLSMMFFPREANHREHGLTARQETAVRAATRARTALRRGEPANMRDMRKILLGMDGVARRALSRLARPVSSIGRGGWSRGLSASHGFRVFEVVHQAEQPPRWDNRVYLSDQRDPLGCRKIAIDWRWHDDDMATTMRAQDLYAAALRRAGLGAFEILRPEGKPVIRSKSTAHYMGLTRMHADPRQGVVDAHCEVHGVRNLFIASSGVFTTGGFVNPTLTIVALALRVGDRIKRRLGGGVETGWTDKTPAFAQAVPQSAA